MSLHVFSGKNKKGSAGDSRCTPPEIWKVALEAAGIEEWDLDPASNSFSTIPSKRKWYGTKNNGLELPWSGNVWLNPPFSSMGNWVEKALSEIDGGRVDTISMLTPNAMETVWWKLLALNGDIWSPWYKRIHCPTPNQPKGTPGGGLCLFFFQIGSSSKVASWEKVMRKHGNLTFKYEP